MKKTINKNKTKALAVAFVLVTSFFVFFEAFGDTILDTYTLEANIQQASPADNETFYFGTPFNQDPSELNQDGNRIDIPFTGTITGATIGTAIRGTIGSNENNSFYIRVNNTTDNLISSTYKFDSYNKQQNISNLSIAVTAGDYIEIKWVNPTYATNPSNIRNWINIFVQTSTTITTSGGGGTGGVTADSTTTPAQTQTNLFYGFFLFFITSGGIIYFFQRRFKN